VTEDLVDELGIVDVADVVHPGAAASADEIEVEDALEQLVPGSAVARRREVFGRGDRGLDSGELGDRRRLRGRWAPGGAVIRLVRRLFGQQGLKCWPSRRAGRED
jgi:hypothetical protein